MAEDYGQGESLRLSGGGSSGGGGNSLPKAPTWADLQSNKRSTILKEAARSAVQLVPWNTIPELRNITNANTAEHRRQEAFAINTLTKGLTQISRSFSVMSAEQLSRVASLTSVSNQLVSWIMNSPMAYMYGGRAKTQQAVAAGLRTLQRAYKNEIANFSPRNIATDTGTRGEVYRPRSGKLSGKEKRQIQLSAAHFASGRTATVAQWQAFSTSFRNAVVRMLNKQGWNLANKRGVITRVARPKKKKK